jgi:ubiquinone/menaquinone biosynthesis C-methylase UbiE
MAESFDHGAFTAHSKHSWSSVSESYDKMSALFFPPITSAFLSFVQLRPGQLVLDVACGPGTLTSAAARAVGPSGRVVGVDLAPGMLKLAMSRAVERNLEYREMNAEELDLPESLFNVVLCQLGLMLFARPDHALSEMARVVKKGGAVACLVQGSPEKMLFTSLLMKTMVKHAPELKQAGAPNLYAYAPVGILDQALAKAGLWQIVSSRVSGVFSFASPEEYWGVLTDGGGRSGAMLRSLPEDKRAAIRAEVLAQASALRGANGRVEVPYEVVMAKGLKA